ncbi:MAG TPA: hypothetical protein VFG51_03010 [Candidatus Saccharimonadia bacterium]|nr:hypothetical protein [Candidatus Saccharimonadia bacterium]
MRTTTATVLRRKPVIEPGEPAPQPPLPDGQEHTIFDDRKTPPPMPEHQKLAKVMNQANTVLFRAKTPFPFTIFPTEIVVDETKVSVINHFLFGTGTIHSIELDNILNIELVSGLIFGTLRLELRMLPDEPIEIPFLWRRDAIEARRIIQGLVISTHKGVDFSQVSPTVVRQSLKDVGVATKKMENA